MKQLNRALLLSLLSSFLVFTSCESEDPVPVEEEEEVPAPVTSAFSAKVDGVSFTNFALLGQESTAADVISITASKSGGFPSIGLSFPNDIEAGSYQFKGGTGDNRALYNTESGVEGLHNAAYNTGSLEIISHDRTADVVKGTFSYTAEPSMGNPGTDTYEITEGTFTIQY